MRTYKIYYYAEQHDECHDLEIEIEAKNIFLALDKFKQEISRYKRVYKIEEIVINKIK